MTGGAALQTVRCRLVKRSARGTRRPRGRSTRKSHDEEEQSVYVRHRSRVEWGIGHASPSGDYLEVRFSLCDASHKRFLKDNRLLSRVMLEDEARAARANPARRESLIAALRKGFVGEWETVRALLQILDPSGREERKLVIAGYVPLKKEFSIPVVPREVGSHDIWGRPRTPGSAFSGRRTR